MVWKGEVQVDQSKIYGFVGWSEFGIEFMGWGTNASNIARNVISGFQVGIVATQANISILC